VKPGYAAALALVDWYPNRTNAFWDKSRKTGVLASSLMNTSGLTGIDRIVDKGA